MRCAVVALVLAGCSSDNDPAAVVTSLGAIDGVPADRYNAAVAEWDAAVAEWNALTAERDRTSASDVVVDGQTYEAYADWARAKGKPLTFEAVLDKYR